MYHCSSSNYSRLTSITIKGYLSADSERPCRGRGGGGVGCPEALIRKLLGYFFIAFFINAKCLSELKDHVSSCLSLWMGLNLQEFTYLVVLVVMVCMWM